MPPAPPQLSPSASCPLPHPRADTLCTTYVVQSGDSLWSISNKFGVLQDDLVAALESCLSGWGSSTALQVGQKICLPGYVPACDYVIDSGGGLRLGCGQDGKRGHYVHGAALHCASHLSGTACTVAPLPCCRTCPCSRAPAGDVATCKAYQVQQGDTLTLIASIFGIYSGVRWEGMGAGAGIGCSCYAPACSRVCLEARSGSAA